MGKDTLEHLHQLANAQTQKYDTLYEHLPPHHWAWGAPTHAQRGEAVRLQHVSTTLGYLGISRPTQIQSGMVAHVCHTTEDTEA